MWVNGQCQVFGFGFYFDCQCCFGDQIVGVFIYDVDVQDVVFVGVGDDFC